MAVTSAPTLMCMDFVISDDKVEELRQIVEAEFVEPVTLDDARTMANNLLELHSLLNALATKMAAEQAAE